MASKKTSKKPSKKVEVVFEGSNKVINKKKPSPNIKKRKAPPKKTPVKIAFSKHDSKVEAPKIEAPKEVSTKPIKEKGKTRDYVVIGILTLLIIGLIVLAFLIPHQKEGAPLNDDSSSVIPNTQLSDFNVEEFEQKSLDLTFNILKDMRQYQKNILETHYEELGIDQEKMDACLLENNYLLKDVNLFDFPKVNIIQNNILDAQEAMVVSTPTLFVNGYSLTGSQDYNALTNFIDVVSDSENISLEDQEGSFKYTDSTLKLYYVYDSSSPFLEEQNLSFIDYLKTSDLLNSNVTSIFSTLFDKAKVEFVLYNSKEGKEILKTIGATSLPAIYLVGDVSSLEFNEATDQDLFNLIFEKETTNNGYLLRNEIAPQLAIGSSLNGIYRILDYKSLVKSSDVLLGEEDASTTLVLFTDYDNPLALALEKETLTDMFYESYLDSGKVNLVIKPLATNDIFSIFPILFLKCSEDQNLSLAVHKKLFELNDKIGVQTVYDSVIIDYEKELSDLENEYSAIMGN